MGKNLGTADQVTSMLRTNGVLVEIGGSIRRIPLDKLMDSINEGNEQLLRQVAWGVPLKEYQASTSWGVIGNLDLRNEYEALSGRYMVSNAGLAAKLNPADSTYFQDGTTVVEARGHNMFWAPRLYFLVKTDPITGYKYLWQSMLPIGGHYIEAPCFGAYKGTMVGNALVSRSGSAPAGSRTIDSFWAAAQENGPKWGLTDYDHVRFMAMKALGKYGNTNIQTALGYGVCGSVGADVWTAAASLPVGATKTNGDAYVALAITITNGVNSSRVSLGGIEDFYGFQWEMIQGIYFGSSANTPAQTGTEAYIYEGNRMPSAGELIAAPLGAYRQKARLPASGFVSSMAMGEYFDLLATGLTGDASSYWSDFFYGNTTGQLLLWGGNADGGSYCGLACADTGNAFSTADATIGARLAYYGDLTFMNGTEFMAATA